ncbi:unnamed protein product [Cylicostephanus goldi]|uniref:Uncharacterized protein n=1 Tax=Cylicostephanus goldi TaxID=71465 RepID=A0A3P6S475_CYLGO|nr:unnamed protein product [Cylicostephanus goldi]
MHEKTGPGKLTDFVPEVERAKKEEDKRELSYRRAADEEPRLIRNYDLPPAVTTTVTTTKIAPTIKSAPLSSRYQDDESVSAVLKRSTLPRNVEVYSFFLNNSYDPDWTAAVAGHFFPGNPLLNSSPILYFPHKTTPLYMIVGEDSKRMIPG